MKKFLKTALVLTLAMMFALQIPSAAKATAMNDDATTNGTVTISPASILLKTYYTTLLGAQYKRRWNTTRGVWYDKYWVKVAEPFPGP